MIRFDDILDKLTAKHSEAELALLRKAYVYSAQAHKGQVRRSGEPYLSHPLEVTDMLVEMKMDITTLAAGLLHDILEDTDVTARDMEKEFGKEITDLVEGVTKISRVQTSSPETRQAETIRKIILAMTDDLRVIFIKLADRVHNLKTLKFLPEGKQKTIAKETLEIYAPIANRLGMGRLKAELEDLAFRYVDSDNYFKIAALVDPIKKKSENELKQARKTIAKLLSDNDVKAEIFMRLKRPYSIARKMDRQNIDFSQVYDFMALRIITESVQDCYAALGIIHQNWPHIPNRFRDLISMPKPNLYQSLHTTIITPKKHTIEIQIRSRDMHNLAENGISAHWRYKEANPRSLLKDDKRLRWLRDTIDLYKEQRNPAEFLKSLKTDLIPEEVHVFTPKGKTITLPQGATGLDFAFKIHTEIGLHADKARINGKLLPLKTILKTGDIVDIITSPKVTASRERLNIVFTSTARHHLKRWLNQQDKIRNTELGKKLWNKLIVKAKLPADAVKEKNLLARLGRMTNMRIKNMEDFFALLGYGKLIPDATLIGKLFPEGTPAGNKLPLFKKVVTRVAAKAKPGISVTDGSERAIKLAKCCSPIRGEPIVGYITSGHGLTIHARRCTLVTKEILDSRRMVDVEWDSSAKGDYSAKLTIRSQDTPGVLAKLTSAIAATDGNIIKAEVAPAENSESRIKLTLRISDIKHLESLMERISAIEEILSVERR